MIGHCSTASAATATPWRSRKWWPGTARWSWEFAAAFWATPPTPTTLSRPPGWCWPAARGSIRDADRLGPWLFGVAQRVALKARTQRAKRRDRPGGPTLANLADLRPERSDLADLTAILDGELAQLSRKLREPVVLCLLQGATVEEAAARLGCPINTAKSRLARGREALRHRLMRRGVAPALIGSSLPLAVASSVEASLIRATLAAALAPSASLAPTVAALARGVAPAMMTKLTVATTSVLLSGFALAGAYLVAAPQDPAPVPPPAANAPKPVPADAGSVSRRHLREICLGMHIFSNNDPEARFPAQAILGTDGQPKLSWRVALLPHLGQEALYQQFHLAEPWDSPHNKTLIERMPTSFESPDSPAPAGMTRFRRFSGAGHHVRWAERHNPGVGD